MTKMPEIVKQMRTEAEEIFRHSLTAVDPHEAVKRFVRREGDQWIIGGEAETQTSLDLNKYDRVLIVGAGKATAPMVRAVEEMLKERIHKGVISVKYGFTQELVHTKIIEAGHPVPDENSVRATNQILALLQSAGENDLVISLISGGGSALLCRPADDITLSEKQEMTKMLLACGASIHEMNAVRKHVSLAKGGQLARAAFPSTVVNLMLSDVVGDRIDVIASGPFVPDASTFKEVADIFGKYQLTNLPSSVRRYVEAGLRGDVDETPKHGDRIFDRVYNVVVGSNIIALKAAEERARALGYDTLILSSMVEGETREVALVHSAIAKEIVKTGQPLPPPACIISGGETTVTLRGKGLGGRNQEFCLAAALDMVELPMRVVILSGGSDGNDGPTDAAGAVVDPLTVRRGREAGLDAEEFLENNDAYHFFEKTRDLLVTGPTNTNVMDVRFILVR